MSFVRFFFSFVQLTLLHIRCIFGF